MAGNSPTYGGRDRPQSASSGLADSISCTPAAVGRRIAETAVAPQLQQPQMWPGREATDVPEGSGPAL